MKINNIISKFGAAFLAGGMMACSSDYLDLTPNYDVAASDVTSSESALTLATYGLCQGMYRQYGGGSWTNWFDGEPMWMQTFGEATGQDFISYFWEYRGRSIPQWTAMADNSSQYDYQGWMYCYYLVSEANNILAADTRAEGGNIEGEVAFRLAEAYTIRAHAYVHLLQMYGPRWQDSNNGSAKSVVLRTKPTADEEQDSPLVPMSTVLDQIYSDLDNAIELYKVSGWTRDYYFEPDIEVAQGVYARAALLKNDWQTAYTMATAAMANASSNIGARVMSVSEYARNPFNQESNPENLWASPASEQNLYYWSSFSITGCNGGYTLLWAILGGGAIDWEFYQEVGLPNDIRSERFFTPDKVPSMYADFWNTDYILTSGILIDSTPDDVTEEYSPLADQVLEYSMGMYDQIGRPAGFSYAPYYYGGLTNVPFGGHYKFWCNSIYGSGSFPYMRYSEMVLTAAEAACNLNNDSAAQALMDELQENRIIGYTGTTQTGDALLEYVKLTRRWELWGEGFNFFDFKRWNEPISRQRWVAGDTNSGNWDLQLSGDLGTTEYSGWRWVVPEEETTYNNMVSPGEY